MIDLHMPDGTSFDRRQNRGVNYYDFIDTANVPIRLLFTVNKTCKIRAFDVDAVAYNCTGELTGRLGAVLATGTESTSPEGYLRYTFSPSYSLITRTTYGVQISPDPALSNLDFLYRAFPGFPIARPDATFTGAYVLGAYPDYPFCGGFILEIPKGNMKYVKIRGDENGA